MLLTAIPGKRRAVHAVEFALVAPLLFLLIAGLVVGGMGVFHYQQVAALAREAARHAAVRGTDYAFDTKNPAATQESIYQEVILPKAVSLDPSRLNCTVTWDKNNSPKYVASDETVTTNIVTVTVSYEWIPSAFLGGITVSSTSRMPMSY